MKQTCWWLIGISYSLNIYIYISQITSTFYENQDPNRIPNKYIPKYTLPFWATGPILSILSQYYPIIYSHYLYNIYSYVYIYILQHFMTVALHMSVAFCILLTTFFICRFHFGNISKGQSISCPLDQSPIEQKVEKPEELQRCTGHSLDDIIARL